MKKITLFSTLAILGTLALSTTNVFAADGGVYKSNGQISFVPNEDPTDPVDPTDPENPVDPVDPTDPEGPGEGTAGPLSIDFASSFNFGEQKITSSNQVYKAAAQEYKNSSGEIKKGTNYVQVTDNRGTEAGWKLMVKQDAQFKSSSEKELTGASLQLTNGNIVTASTSAEPASEAAVTLVPGEESKLMNAAAGQGVGTFLLDWGTDETTGGQSVSLSVPGSTTKYAEKYATTLTWTLTDTPDNA